MRPTMAIARKVFFIGFLLQFVFMTGIVLFLSLILCCAESRDPLDCHR